MANRKGARGAGTIRKKTVTRNGKDYTFWEARLTVGHDPGTGKQIQKSISGKTQKEVREKMQALAVELNEETYQEPTKLTVGDWLDIWLQDYLGSVKPKTVVSYTGHVKNHIKPNLGAVKLQALSTHMIQRFYNQKEKDGLSPKTIKNLHGAFHEALNQAVELHYIRFNPSDACKLPRVEKKEIRPLDETAIRAFLGAIQGHRYEAVYLVTLFTGLRRGEVTGLTWDSVDFKTNTLTINKQLQSVAGVKGGFTLVSSKNGKIRLVTVAPFVMEVLRKHRKQQLEERVKAGPLWEDSGFVFTNEFGRHLSPHTVYHNFKRLAASIGLPDARFHDLRHSYAVAALQSGDDIKTVQSNLGHHTAAFTLDTYGHVTQAMRQASADRMERFIKGVSDL